MEKKRGTRKRRCEEVKKIKKKKKRKKDDDEKNKKMRGNRIGGRRWRGGRKLRGVEQLLIA